MRLVIPHCRSRSGWKSLLQVDAVRSSLAHKDAEHPLVRSCQLSTPVIALFRVFIKDSFANRFGEGQVSGKRRHSEVPVIEQRLHCSGHSPETCQFAAQINA